MLAARARHGSDAGVARSAAWCTSVQGQTGSARARLAPARVRHRRRLRAREAQHRLPEAAQVLQRQAPADQEVAPQARLPGDAQQQGRRLRDPGLRV